jgi:anaerobic dimethyl sulfoxide reductase subunit C (anchor subunit)
MQIGIQWPLVLFTLIAGAGCGLLAVTGFARLTVEQGKATRQIALISTLVLLGIGGLMSVFHLAHPERFMAAIANLLSFSGIAMELIGLAFSGLATLLFLAFSSAKNQIGAKVIAACSVVIGVVASFFHGYAYFEVVAQPGWHSLALVFSYMLTSLTAGSLVYAAIASLKTDEKAGLRLIGKVAMGSAALATIAIVVYVVSLGTAGLLQNEAGIVASLAIASELVALFLAACFVFKKSSALLAVGSAVLGIGGGLAVRVLMWTVSTYGLNLIWEAATNRGLYLFP